MNGVDMRRRGGLLFVVVLVAHIIMISAQVPSGARSSVPLLESVAFGVFSEVQRWVSGGLARWQGVWRGYVDLRNVRVENDQLRREVADLQIQLQEQRAQADRTSQLERLLGMRDRSPLKTTAAAVIGAGSTPDFRAMTIDKGTADGLRPDMAVIAPRGIVGRIVVPSARASKVQLLIDRNAAAGALVDRSRAQGVAVGGGDAQRLRFDYVSAAADVQVGDLVVTSGIDGIFPKGFVIGNVQRIERGSSGTRRSRSVPPWTFPPSRKCWWCSPHLWRPRTGRRSEGGQGPAGDIAGAGVTDYLCSLRHQRLGCHRLGTRRRHLHRAHVWPRHRPAGRGGGRAGAGCAIERDHRHRWISQDSGRVRGGHPRHTLGGVASLGARAGVCLGHAPTRRDFHRTLCTPGPASVRLALHRRLQPGSRQRRSGCPSVPARRASPGHRGATAGGPERSDAAPAGRVVTPVLGAHYPLAPDRAVQIRRSALEWTEVHS